MAAVVIGTGIAFIIELYKRYKELKETADGIASELKGVYGKLKRPEPKHESIVFWNGHKYNYIYHVDTEIRDFLYNYLDSGEILKRTGLVFATQGKTQNGATAVDIGVHALLPFYNIARNYGKETIDGKKIASICYEFAKNIEKEDEDSVKKAVESTKLLIKFVFEKCGDDNFLKLFLKGGEEFTKIYKNLESDIAKGATFYNKKLILSRFIRSSFSGIFINDDDFKVLGTREAAWAFLKKIHSKYNIKGQRRLEHTYRWAKEKVENRMKEVGPEVVKGTKGWIVSLTNTTAVFDPTEKDKLVERWLGGKSTFRIILASKRKISKFRMLFEAFKDEIITFDREIRIVYGKDEMGYYRVPIILNVYRGDENKAQSVCIAYNARKDEVQQIKFAKTELHSVEEECKEIIIRYFIKDRRILPSEQGVVRKLF